MTDVDVLSLTGVAIDVGGRRLWTDVDLTVGTGEVHAMPEARRRSSILW